MDSAMDAHAQTQPEPPAQAAPSPADRRRDLGCFAKGCGLGIGLLVLGYALHAAYLFGENVIYRDRWEKRGSPNYVATVWLTSMSPFQGPNTITVKAGTVVAVQSYSEPNANPSWQDFQEMTVEGLFSDVKECILYFPLLTCSYRYDPDYGYPKEVVINCPLPDACYEHLSVEKMEPLAP